jgi:hypothetical protein
LDVVVSANTMILALCGHAQSYSCGIMMQEIAPSCLGSLKFRVAAVSLRCDIVVCACVL